MIAGIIFWFWLLSKLICPVIHGIPNLIIIDATFIYYNINNKSHLLYLMILNK